MGTFDEEISLRRWGLCPCNWPMAGHAPSPVLVCAAARPSLTKSPSALFCHTKKNFSFLPFLPSSASVRLPPPLTLPLNSSSFSLRSSSLLTCCSTSTRWAVVSERSPPPVNSSSIFQRATRTHRSPTSTTNLANPSPWGKFHRLLTSSLDAMDL